MANPNKSRAEARPGRASSATETETAPELPETQPAPGVTETETQTENMPKAAQAPKSQTSKKLALRKERLGR